MKEQGNRRRKIIGLALTAAIVSGLIFAAAAQAVSWLNEREEAKASLAISDFEITGVAFFSAETDEAALAAELADLTATSSGTLNSLQDVNLTDEAADNYIGKLRFGVKYSGISPALIRVRILEQWIDVETEEVLSAEFTPYLTASGWIDHRTEDYCYYSKGTVPAAAAVTGGSISEALAVRKENLILIKGVDTAAMSGGIGGNLREDVRLKLVFEVQGAQPNRFRELFELENYPQ